MKDKYTARVIIMILLVSFIVHFFFALINNHHVCNHDDSCPICLLIYKFKNNLNGLSFYFSRFVIDIFVFFLPILLCFKSRLIDKKKDTLVGLKMELIN